MESETDIKTTLVFASVSILITANLYIYINI